ncbi:hypothetical protein ACFCVO_05400 [Agromyces sp. NPDC056379]|uniref:hypothetical protein n=1 Tax=unclassified Agromyces TaxID=2639701 RepID=UPI0035DB8BB8
MLSIIALDRHRPMTVEGGVPGGALTAVATDAAEATPEQPEVTATPTTVGSRVLASLDANTAVRASVTTCPTPTSIEVTADGGATWEAFTADRIAAVQRITVGADAFIGMLGLAVEGCTPTFERSFVGGAAWEAAPGEAASSWYVDASNRGVLHTPTGDRSAPCAAAVQIAVVDQLAAGVLCDDGTLHATADAGVNWMPPISMPGAGAIAAGGSGYLVVDLHPDECAGARLIEVSIAVGGLSHGAAGACLTATAAAGEVAISTAADGTTWLWAGDALGRTDDGGTTWL